MQNLDYLKGLIKRIEKSAEIVKKAETPEEISKQERDTHPVLKEIQMVAPRLWDDYIKLTRENRQRIQEGK